MELLEQRIRQDGKVKGDSILKVDSFLNHQMDIELFSQMGQEFYRLFGSCGVNKILTIEASGIGMACVAAQYFHSEVVFSPSVSPLFSQLTSSLAVRALQKRQQKIDHPAS